MYIHTNKCMHTHTHTHTHTCTTALQNSSEFRNICRSMILQQSSSVSAYQSSDGGVIFLGSEEYRPLRPVARTCETKQRNVNN